MSQPRQTFDFGIDLGTTNSAIAVLNGVTPRIIKNMLDDDITPSAVHINKRQEVLVGKSAKAKQAQSGRADTQIEFKRVMGTQQTLAFKSSGVTKLPEELSAEILKSLRTDVARAIGEEPMAAVITVPAAFETHQTSATMKAAKLAGFSQVALLQEPVAAALAYGFQATGEKAYWLVFDFGGGTFDAALIKAEDGTVTVVHHGGDNFLGGSDIDWAFVEQVILPKIHAQNPGSADWLVRSNSEEKSRLGMDILKHFAEAAKVALSSSVSTTIDIPSVIEAADGTKIDCADITVTREELLSVATPLIDKAIDISLRVLEEKGVPSSSVDRVILVGGPTKASYFRERLKERLPIRIDHSVDPMTVVASGAAIFAGTQKISGERAVAKAGMLTIDLKYEPQGSSSEPTIGGRLLSKEVTDFTGWKLRISEGSSAWSSASLPVRKDGVFITKIKAEAGRRNVFTIEVTDPNGSLIPTEPSTFTYTIGASSDGQPLINSLNIGLADNAVLKVHEKGQLLPLKKKVTKKILTVTPVKAGDASSKLLIPVVEGESDKADRNRYVGDLVITGEMIKRDLPTGTEVEIDLNVDQSRIIQLRVYISLIDEEFEAKIGHDIRKTTGDDPKILRDSLARELRRVTKLKAALDVDDKATLDALSDTLVPAIESDLSAAEGGDNGACQKADKTILELQTKLDDIEELAKWPKVRKELVDSLRMGERILNDGLIKDGDAENMRQLLEAGNKALASKKIPEAKDAYERIDTIYFRAMQDQPAYWLGWLRHSADNIQRFSDQGRAKQVIALGMQATQSGDIDALRNAVRQLWGMLPKEDRDDFERGVGAGIR
jgi:molecular chaperone DnaK